MIRDQRSDQSDQRSEIRSKIKDQQPHLHPVGHVVHLEGGERVVEVHLQAGHLSAHPRSFLAVLGGGAHVERVVDQGLGRGELKDEYMRMINRYLSMGINQYQLITINYQSI